MIGTLRGQKQSEVNLFVGMRAAGKSHVLGLLDFLASRALAGVQDFVGHVGVSAAGRHAVHLHVIVAHLFRQGLDEADHGGLGSRIGREARTARSRAASADHHDLAAPAFDHLRQDGPAGVHGAHQVGLDSLGPGARLDVHQHADGPLNGSRRDQHVDAAEDRAHTLHRGAHLLIIAHVGADTQRRASGVLDLQLGQIQLGLAASQQADTRAFRGESDGQALADTTARSGYQDRLIL